jgi:hypothetical protein
MKFDRRLTALEGRHTDRGDGELAEKTKQARARVDADDHEHGVVRPPREPLEFPTRCTALAEQLVWARNHHALGAEARR